MASIGIMLDCNKTCTVIFLSLILMTAGFVLTLMGWFAPPMNNFVLNVRMGGPIALLIGFVFMLCSCLMCAIDQGRCFQCCHKRKNRPMKIKHKKHRTMNDNNPWILRSSKTDDINYTDGESGSNVVDESIIIVNHTAQVKDQKDQYHKGYQLVDTEDKQSDREDILQGKSIMQGNASSNPQQTQRSSKNTTAHFQLSHTPHSYVEGDCYNLKGKSKKHSSVNSHQGLCMPSQCQLTPNKSRRLECDNHSESTIVQSSTDKLTKMEQMF